MFVGVVRGWAGGCAVSVHSLYRSSTRGPEDDSVESKHVAPLSHYMFNITTVVFDGPSPLFISQTLRDGTPQV